jgi:hypothetical protein
LELPVASHQSVQFGYVIDGVLACGRWHLPSRYLIPSTSFLRKSGDPQAVDNHVDPLAVKHWLAPADAA